MSAEAGSLRHRVLLEQRTVVDDPLGGEIVTWVPVSTLAGDGFVWANVRFQTGMETLRTNVVIGTTKASIRIRYRDDVGQTTRATYRGEVYDIKSVQPDSESGIEYLDLVCEAGSNDG